jgi:hypothetical protein
MAPGEQKKHTQRLELEQNNQKNHPPITLNQKTPGFSAACKARTYLPYLQHCVFPQPVQPLRYGFLLPFPSD